MKTLLPFAIAATLFLPAASLAADDARTAQLRPSRLEGASLHGSRSVRAQLPPSTASDDFTSGSASLHALRTYAA